MTAHICLMGDANSVHVRRWAGEMLARGLRVTLVTARPQHMDGVEQRVLAPVRRSADWLSRVGEARRHIDESMPDLVHAHYVTSYGYLAARTGRHPLVMTAWGSDILVTPFESRLKRWITGWTLRRADLITGDSHDLIKAVSAYRPKAQLAEIHWGADMSKFRPAPWRDKVGFQIVSLRAWEPNYRIDKIIEGMGLFLKSNPEADARLHLLGGGSLENELKSQVRALGLSDRVNFAGRVGDAEMVATLQMCKVSISIPASDATSVSVLESMACGLPVIGSDLPANRQWLGSDAGLLVSEGSAAEVAAAFERLWRDDAGAQKIGAENHSMMLEKGARSVQMDAVEKLYQGLLRNHPQGARFA